VLYHCIRGSRQSFIIRSNKIMIGSQRSQREKAFEGLYITEITSDTCIIASYLFPIFLVIENKEDLHTQRISDLLTLHCNEGIYHRADSRSQRPKSTAILPHMPAFSSALKRSRYAQRREAPSDIVAAALARRAYVDAALLIFSLLAFCAPISRHSSTNSSSLFPQRTP